MGINSRSSGDYGLVRASFGEFRQIWAGVGKSGQIWIGKTDRAGLDDISSGRMGVCLQI